MDHGLAIDIQKFADTVDTESNPEFVKHLKEALIWLGKRQDYSHEYYRQLKRSASHKKLEASLFMDDHMVRVRFEAANLAHLQNIHAACDAFPFALHVLLGGLSTAKIKSENEHFKWNRSLIDEVAKRYPHATALNSALSEFATDTNFLMLASLVNQAKHKFFPRLHCNLDVPANRYFLSIKSFEYLTFSTGKPTANTKENLNVLEFAKLIHDDTLFKLFGLYRLAYECVSK
jgi:hypothetical protein